MKMLSITLFAFTIFFSTEHKSTHSEQSAKAQSLKNKEISLELDFGNWKKNCRQVGVCSASVRDGVKMGKDDKARANGAIAKAEIGGKGESIIMTFYKYSMTGEAIKKHFSNGYFIVEEPFNEVLKNGKDVIDLNLKRGKYKIENVKEGYRVKFK